MRTYDPRAAARDALAARPDRPATAMIHDTEAGTVVTYEPRGPHGMRAIKEELTLLAVIAPRPASR